MKKYLLAFLPLLFIPFIANAAISLVQGPYTNNYSGTSQAFSSNVTSGNLLLVSMDVNSASALNVTSTGAGCVATTWTLATTGISSSGYHQYTWYGTAAATGACTVTASANYGNTGVFASEYSGVNTSTPIDVKTGGGSSGNVYALTLTAASSTAFANEYGYFAWSSGYPTTFASTGWTTGTSTQWNGTAFQANIASGTTLVVSSTYNTGGSASFVANNLITLRPATAAATSTAPLPYNKVLAFDW